MTAGPSPWTMDRNQSMEQKKGWRPLIYGKINAKSNTCLAHFKTTTLQDICHHWYGTSGRCVHQHLQHITATVGRHQKSWKMYYLSFPFLNRHKVQDRLVKKFFTSRFPRINPPHSVNMFIDTIYSDHCVLQAQYETQGPCLCGKMQSSPCR